MKVRHISTGLYIRLTKDNRYTLSKHGSVLPEIKWEYHIYNKMVALYVNKYTKTYEDTYNKINWSETYNPTRLFCWVNINKFEIEK